MIKKNLIWFGCIAAFAMGCSSGDSKDAATGAGAMKDSGAPTMASFTSVQEIFTKNCTGCHGADKPKGGINLTSHEGVMKGGEDGPIVTAGDPDKSKLVDALRGRHGAKQMPMNAAPLPEDSIKTIEAWIKDGAKA
jgi:mono/diheme cytochrome c family protein